jgi:hypothetical protein
MGIETCAEHGGAGSSFTSAIIAIEELAKVDPSVSVMCDVHNTLVNTIFRKYATKEQQDEWLPQLAENKVCKPSQIFIEVKLDRFPLAGFILLVRTCFGLGCLCVTDTCEEGWR